MEARIKYHIQGIFMLNQKPIPPTLNKHLTNKIFNKPNKEGMEQVLYHLLPLTNPKCLKTVSWPITTFKEAAEFRNAATLIINGLKGFVYEKSPNVVGKVNSSLLANPGGPVFVFFMYQLCLFIKCGELKKKGIDFLKAPSYVEDAYIDKKISMFDRISKSNFSKVNEIISRVDNTLQNTTEFFIKYKEIIQDCKQHIKNLKSQLLNIEHCEATENEVAELKQKYIHFYDNFEHKKLIAMKCAKLADIISKSPESYDANMINITFNVDNDELMRHDGKVNLVQLLTSIKNTLIGYISWCEQINDEQEINDHILVIQQSVNDMSEQVKCYESLLTQQNNLIDNLKIENKTLDVDIFNNKSFENIDPRLQSVYKQISPIVLKTDLTDKPKPMTSEDYRKSRRSILSHSSSKPYNYQAIFFDDIKNVYRATLPNQNEVDVNNDMCENSIEQSPSCNKLNEAMKATSVRTNDDEKSLDKTYSNRNQPLLTIRPAESDESDVINIGSRTHINEDEIKRVCISRKSIENVKQKFIKIKKQAQMSTIPHSPQMPL